MNFEEQHAFYIASCEQAIAAEIKNHFQAGSMVSQAAEYSALNGGKRVRGVLTLATSSLLGGGAAPAASFAAGVEMVHAFSLVHDDLPCMDDDDMRRGKPACHIVYGEANALLAGDLLAIAAFATLAGAPSQNAAMNNTAVQVLAAASGAKGMIYGQELDMLAEETPVDETGLHTIHQHKTGALIVAAAHLGIVAAGQSIAAHPAITQYAQNLGAVFQIIDDILDVTADETVLGKPTGSDDKNGKTTFVSLHGVAKARQIATQLTQQAMNGLAEYGDKAEFLNQFAQTLLQRVY
ncbi:polyprenyl synthetase family protein [Ruminococcaceae bacterium OttesenSCG-928-A16]|nr:polyprenyl synthetase family protein [Ruminococcaceae bacterium OttesenSCG-928-A16]